MTINVKVAGSDNVQKTVPPTNCKHRARPSTGARSWEIGVFIALLVLNMANYTAAATEPCLHASENFYVGETGEDVVTYCKEVSSSSGKDGQVVTNIASEHLAEEDSSRPIVKSFARERMQDSTSGELTDLEVLTSDTQYSITSSAEGSENLCEVEDAVTYCKVHQEVLSSIGKDGELVANIASEHVEGVSIDGGELELPAKEDTSRPIVLKCSPRERMMQDSTCQALTNLEVLRNVTQYGNKSSAQLLEPDHQGGDAKWTMYSVYQFLETSMARPGNLFISAELKSKETRRIAVKQFPVRIMETRLRGKHGVLFEPIVMHQYLALHISPATWVEAEITKGRSKGQTGIHVKLETGFLQGRPSYEVYVSGVDVTLGQIVDRLVALEPEYNMLKNNCWYYAYSGTKAILELCIANAVDDQARKTLEEQLSDLENYKPFMPKDFAGLLHPNAIKVKVAFELLKMKMVQKVFSLLLEGIGRAVFRAAAA